MTDSWRGTQVGGNSACITPDGNLLIAFLVRETTQLALSRDDGITWDYWTPSYSLGMFEGPLNLNLSVVTVGSHVYSFSWQDWRIFESSNQGRNWTLHSVSDPANLLDCKIKDHRVDRLVLIGRRYSLVKTGDGPFERIPICSESIVGQECIPVRLVSGVAGNGEMVLHLLDKLPSFYSEHDLERCAADRRFISELLMGEFLGEFQDIVDEHINPFLFPDLFRSQNIPLDLDLSAWESFK
jgi:hypothetical protein